MQGSQHMHVIRIAALVVALTTCVRAAEPRRDGPLKIALNPAAEVSDRVVRIADIAKISGGNAVQRDRIGALDLVEMDEAGDSLEVRDTLVQARLLLSGVAPANFEIGGASTTQVSWYAGHGAEQRALDAARRAVSEQLAISAADITVQLSQPLPTDISGLIDATDVAQLTARSVTPPGGRTRIDLWVADGKGGQIVRPIAVDVRFRQMMPVAVRPISARQKLVADDIALETRELPQRGVGLTLEQLEGRTLRRAVAAGEIISERDLLAIVDEKAPVIIRPRDVVRVTAKKGRLTLVLPTAEAMQAGRLGETIRVRNTTSGRTVIGRVTGPGEVEVPL